MKIGGDVLQALITFIVGGGFVGLVSQLIKVRGSLRAGARASTRAIVRDMADDRKEAEARAEHQARVAEYWRAVAGNYSFQLRTHGITPDPATPNPPEQAVAADARARRKSRELEDTLDNLRLDE